MKSWLGKLCATGLLAGVLLGTGSCADNENMLVIVGVMSAQPPDCIYSPAAGSLLLFNGIVDMAFGGRYIGVLLVANELASRGNKSRLRAESSDITINNAVVNLLGNGTVQLGGGSFSVPASGHVPVGSGEDTGYGAISIDIMPGISSVDASIGYIIAEVKLQGKTSGGKDIESNTFRYEINVVDSRSGAGGLVSYNNPDRTCNSSLCTTTSSTSRTYCYMGQDGAVPCCDCLALAVCSG